VREGTGKIMSEEMLESMDAYKDELEKSFRRLEVGDIIAGTVIDVTEEALYIDLKYYAQGVIPITEITEDPSFIADESFHQGDEVQGTIMKMDDGQGNILLSMKEANQVLAWERLEAYKQEERVLSVKISGVVNAGVTAYLEGIRAFIPASQLSLNYVENLEEWNGKTVEAVVITADGEKGKLVLSAKAVERKKKEEELASKKARLVPGTVFEGTVESIMPYGAFINLGDGLSGLVHVSRICQRRIKSPTEVLKEGERVKVKLLDVKDGKLSLSMKEFEEISGAEPDGAETFEYHEEGEATTSLGGFFAGMKFPD